jgi:Trk-type K+ transport system membrane component
VATSLGNVGPALGALGPTHHYLDVEMGVRNVLMIVMLAGRLELYPVLLGVVPLLRVIGNMLPTRMARALVRVGRG